MKITKIVDLQATPEAIWPLVSDFEEMKRWRADLLAQAPVETKDEVVGSTYELTLSEAGQEHRYEAVVTACEPGRRYATRWWSGAFTITHAFELTPKEDGVTELRTDIEFRYASVWIALVMRLFGRTHRRMTNQSMDRLTALFEPAEEKPADP